MVGYWGSDGSGGGGDGDDDGVVVHREDQVRVVQDHFVQDPFSPVPSCQDTSSQDRIL